MLSSGNYYDPIWALNSLWKHVDYLDKREKELIDQTLIAAETKN